MKRSTRFSTIPSGVRTVKHLDSICLAVDWCTRPRGNQTKQRALRALTSDVLKQGKNFRASALIVLALGFPVRGLPAPSTSATQRVETLAALRARLQRHVTRPRFAAAQSGVKIVSLAKGD